VVEKNDNSEGGDDMVEMVAIIEPAEYQEFEQQSEGECGKERKRRRGEKILRQRIKRNGKIGAQHVLHAVGKIDEIHHPENERETRRDEKQQNAELEAVENLNDEESRIHAPGSITSQQEGVILAERAQRARAGTHNHSPPGVIDSGFAASQVGCCRLGRYGLPISGKLNPRSGSAPE
jgi:hypothetical protein